MNQRIPIRKHGDFVDRLSNQRGTARGPSEGEGSTHRIVIQPRRVVGVEELQRLFRHVDSGSGEVGHRFFQQGQIHHIVRRSPPVLSCARARVDAAFDLVDDGEEGIVRTTWGGVLATQDVEEGVEGGGLDGEAAGFEDAGSSFADCRHGFVLFSDLCLMLGHMHVKRAIFFAMLHELLDTYR